MIYDHTSITEQIMSQVKNLILNIQILMLTLQKYN